MMLHGCRDNVLAASTSLHGVSNAAQREVVAFSAAAGEDDFRRASRETVQHIRNRLTRRLKRCARCFPALCRLDGLPKTVVHQELMAWSKRGSVGVVAL